MLLAGERHVMHSEPIETFINIVNDRREHRKIDERERLVKEATERDPRIVC